jgi:ribosomal protein S27E
MIVDNARNTGRKNGTHRELNLAQEAPAVARAAERRAGRMELRLYCVLCGRSEIVRRAPARPGRCPGCGGTLLTEPEPA